MKKEACREHPHGQVQHIGTLLEAHRILPPAQRWWWRWLKSLRKPRRSGYDCSPFPRRDKMWINNIVGPPSAHALREELDSVIMEGEGTVCVCMCVVHRSLVMMGRFWYVGEDDWYPGPRSGIHNMTTTAIPLKPWHGNLKSGLSRTFKCIHGLTCCWTIYLHCCACFMAKVFHFIQP